MNDETEPAQVAPPPMTPKLRAPFSLALLLASLLFTGCTTDSARSTLYFHKQALIRYHDSGRYDAEVQRVAGGALDHIRRRAASGGTNLAVVLDIDDTAISTWSRLRQDDFARKDTLFVQWASTNSAVAIEPVLNLYRETRRLGVKVFFMTGRREPLAECTRESLKQAGY